MSERPRLADDPPGKPQDHPFVTQCLAGKYAHCACGKSQSYPMCDGSHRGSDIQPTKVILEEDKTVAWCACGKTANAPYCDGSHSR